MRTPTRWIAGLFALLLLILAAPVAGAAEIPPEESTMEQQTEQRPEAQRADHFGSSGHYQAGRLGSVSGGAISVGTTPDHGPRQVPTLVEVGKMQDELADRLDQLLHQAIPIAEALGGAVPQSGSVGNQQESPSGSALDHLGRTARRSFSTVERIENELRCISHLVGIST
jgi:hypothetical protein